METDEEEKALEEVDPRNRSVSPSRWGPLRTAMKATIIFREYCKAAKMETIFEEDLDSLNLSSLEDMVFEEDEERWTNQSLEICEKTLGKEKFKKRMNKAKKKHSVGFGSKTRLSYLSSKIKKLTTSSSGIQHYNAVGAVGYAVVRPDSAIPENKFFVKDKRFRVRLRHCAIRCQDDAASCVRQAALKFADQNEDGPLDLILFTGRVALARNCKTFYEVLSARSSEECRLLCEKDPEYYFALVDSLRRSPFSYKQLHYHSQLPYLLITKDEKPRMVKFRLIPGNNFDPETGLLSNEEQHAPWRFERKRINHKPKDYLRKSFIKSLEDSPIQYKLQIQLHNMNGGANDDEDLWSPQNVWEENDHPWLDLMDIIFTTPLPPTATNRTAFNIVNRPQCMCIQPPSSVWDFPSYHYSCSTMYTTMELKNINQINSDTDKEELKLLNMVSYIVTLSTGHGNQGGLKVDVFITLTGTSGRTVPVRLDRTIDGSNDSDENSYFKIRVQDVGDILAVTIGVRHRQLTAGWMLRSVSLADMDNSHIRFFPCHRLVTSKVTLRSGNVCLPSREVHEVLGQERALEIRDKQCDYQWRKRSSMPSTINAQVPKDLPVEERLLAEKYIGLPWDLEATMTEMTIHNKSTQSFRMGQNMVRHPPREHRRHHSTCEEDIGTNVTNRRRSLSAFQSLPSRKTSMVLRRTSTTSEKAKQKWSKIKHVLHFITKASAKIPNGVKGEMCRACLEDPDFGRLFLQGPNPLVIKRIKEIPDALGVDIEMLENLMERDLTFQEEMNAGRIFCADYSLLTSIPTYVRDGITRYLAAPVVLLYVNGSGDLIPIAIQLRQEKGKDNPVWQPLDSADEWLLAKLWVRNADTIQQLGTHIFYCHLVIEPFVVATMRQLSTSHPIYKILKPHFRYVLAGNTLIRMHVLSKGGALDRWTSVGSAGMEVMFLNLYKNFQMDDLDFLLDLKKRGMENSTKITNYYYREDGIKLWNAVQLYCSNVVQSFYESDNEVRRDCEIQAWLHDVRENGFPNRADQIGLPESFLTREELTKIICRILFTVTCRHAATHSEAMDMYGHDASVPASMRQPPPCEKGLTQTELTVETLPDQKPELYCGAIAYIMSMKKADPSALGQSAESYFVDSEAKVAHEQFGKQLAFISKVINKRNANLESVYDKLLPENVPNSVEPLPFMPDAEPEMEGPIKRDGSGRLSLPREQPSVPLLTMPLCMTFARSIGGKSTLGRRLSVNMFSRAMSGVDMGRVSVPMTALDRNKFSLNRMHYSHDGTYGEH